MIIDTPHLRLRPVTTADVDDLVALDSDPAVMRYVSGGAPTPPETIAHWVVPRAIAALAAGLFTLGLGVGEARADLFELKWATEGYFRTRTVLLTNLAAQPRPYDRSRGIEGGGKDETPAYAGASSARPERLELPTF